MIEVICMKISKKKQQNKPLLQKFLHIPAVANPCQGKPRGPILQMNSTEVRCKILGNDGW